MRIAWITPFNEYSAVGRQSYGICRELTSRGFDVKIIRAEIAEAARLPAMRSDLPVLAFTDVKLNRLRAQFDLAVAAIADHFPFTGSSLQLLSTMPSVGVFHDANPENLTFAMKHAGMIEAATLARLQKLGDRVPTACLAVGADLYWLATLCVGVILHGHHYLAPLAAGCPGPSIVLPLCFAYPGVLPTRPRCRKDITVVTFGFLNANKQADRVMRAIAASSLKHRAVYRLAGEIRPEERTRLQVLAQQLGISPPEFLGWLPEKELHGVLADANVICCLRYPILEGGSGSLVFSLYSGNPVVVVNAGVYSEVPDDLVWRVSYGTEASDLSKTLESIIENQNQADAKAERALSWARQIYSVRSYVDALVPFLKECQSLLPLMDAARSSGKAMHRLGLAIGDPAIRTIAQDMYGLFGRHDRPC